MATAAQPGPSPSKREWTGILWGWGGGGGGERVGGRDERKERRLREGKEMREGRRERGREEWREGGRERRGLGN